MTDGAHAVGLLIAEAWAVMRQSRYAKAADVAGRAVAGAEQVQDAELLVRALDVRASALRMSGDYGAALVDCTRILGLAEDPGTAGRLGGRTAAWAITGAYIFWVEAARFRGGASVRELFAVLDAGERWLAATGRSHWRSGLLSQRADLHRRLGETEAAIACAEEALATDRPDVPGPTLGAHRFTLADLLRDAGRHSEAAPHYQAILDDPASIPYERMSAYQGLASCAVAERDLPAARRHADAAVRLGEGIGDNALTLGLGALVAVCRAGEDLDAAWEAASLRREAAERVGVRYALYYALRDAVDVALDRRDVDTARALLADVEGHAVALDADTGTGGLSAETSRRRERLARLAPDEARP